mgnify:CR=1 FL=1
MIQTKVEPLNKRTIKDLKKTLKWAENEIAEYEEFIQFIRKELRERQKLNV